VTGEGLEVLKQALVEVAEDIAAAWGSLFIDAGEAGHLNADAGFGPWPEGSMTFAKFLTELNEP